jgi:hypothetical protein
MQPKIKNKNKSRKEEAILFESFRKRYYNTKSQKNKKQKQKRQKSYNIN